jgi:hypothetical protein
LKYEPGPIIADGDFVIVHGRFSRFGLAVNCIAAEILRTDNGILVEHWDVIGTRRPKSNRRAKRRCSLVLSRLFQTVKNEWMSCVAAGRCKAVEFGAECHDQQHWQA